MTRNQAIDILGSFVDDILDSADTGAEIHVEFGDELVEALKLAIDTMSNAPLPESRPSPKQHYRNYRRKP